MDADESDELPGFDDGEEVIELHDEIGGQLRPVSSAAFADEFLDQSRQGVETSARKLLAQAPHAAPVFARGFAGDRGVDPIDDRLERGVLPEAGMAQRDDDLGDDVAWVFPHHDDAIRHQDRLFDVVGDHQDGLRGEGLVQPELHELAAQGFGRQNVERRERLVQAQKLGLDRHRSREADLLAHSAGELARVGGFETVEADVAHGEERLGAAPERFRDARQS